VDRRDVGDLLANLDKARAARQHRRPVRRRQRLDQETGEVRTTRGWFAPKSKMSPTTAACATPVMIRWPGHTKAPYDDLVSTVDWCRRC